MSIQLEVGKTYVTRRGHLVKIITRNPKEGSSEFIGSDELSRWADGHWNGDKMQDPDDLVAEAPTEGTVDKATPSPDVLDAAAYLRDAASTMAERGKQYDSPEGERSMGKTVQAFNTITGQDLTEAQGWAFMSVLKKVRQYQAGAHLDSCVDDVAYTALFAEARMQEKRS